MFCVEEKYSKIILVHNNTTHEIIENRRLPDSGSASAEDDSIFGSICMRKHFYYPFATAGY